MPLLHQLDNVGYVKFFFCPCTCNRAEYRCLPLVIFCICNSIPKQQFGLDPWRHCPLVPPSPERVLLSFKLDVVTQLLLFPWRVRRRPLQARVDTRANHCNALVRKLVGVGYIFRPKMAALLTVFASPIRATSQRGVPTEEWATVRVCEM